MEVEKLSAKAYTGNHRSGGRQLPLIQQKEYHENADSMERGLDLNEQLVQNKHATFFMRVTGNSMINAGIGDGDIVIVDRSIKPQSGRIVIAIIDGDMLIRRLEKTMNKIRLIPETPKLSPIDVSEFHGLVIWGVVTFAIKQV